MTTDQTYYTTRDAELRACAAKFREIGYEGLAQTVDEELKLLTSNEAMQDRIGELLEALGLPNVAMPKSPNEVMLDIIAHVKRERVNHMDGLDLLRRARIYFEDSPHA